MAAGKKGQRALRRGSAMRIGYNAMSKPGATGREPLLALCTRIWSRREQLREKQKLERSNWSIPDSYDGDTASTKTQRFSEMCSSKLCASVMQGFVPISVLSFFACFYAAVFAGTGAHENIELCSLASNL